MCSDNDGAFDWTAAMVADANAATGGVEFSDKIIALFDAIVENGRISFVVASIFEVEVIPPLLFLIFLAQNQKHFNLHHSDLRIEHYTGSAILFHFSTKHFKTYELKAV